MKVTEIAFTGYPVTNLKRARQFYEGVLGLKPSHVFGDEQTARQIMAARSPAAAKRYGRTVRNFTDAAYATSPRFRRLIKDDPRRFYYPFMIVLAVVIGFLIFQALPTQLIMISANMAKSSAPATSRMRKSPAS
jgi:hypothetical protein